MSLIARFCFEEGNPVDVRIQPDKKKDLIEAFNTSEVFYDETGESAFWANKALTSCFFIQKEAPPAPKTDGEDPADAA